MKLEIDTAVAFIMLYGAKDLFLKILTTPSMVFLIGFFDSQNPQKISWCYHH